MLALDLDLSFVSGGDRAREREAQPAALLVARPGPIGAPEAVEDVGQVGRGDPNAVVRDRYYGASVAAFSRNLDPAASRGVLGGVIHHNQQNTADCVRIGVNRNWSGGQAR